MVFGQYCGALIHICMHSSQIFLLVLLSLVNLMWTLPLCMCLCASFVVVISYFMLVWRRPHDALTGQLIGIFCVHYRGTSTPPPPPHKYFTTAICADKDPLMGKHVVVLFGGGGLSEIWVRAIVWIGESAEAVDFEDIFVEIVTQ